MTVRFDPTRRTIRINGTLASPTRVVTLDLLLDTGASDTFVSESKLVAAGYDLTTPTNRYTVVTGSGAVLVSEFRALVFSALGQVRMDFPVLSHTFPPGTNHDGVVGLGFLRGNVLTIDFVNGAIDLSPGHPARPTP